MHLSSDCKIRWMSRFKINMNSHDILLGYDLRENWLTFGEMWDAERSERFLWRQDIEKPLSADSYIWPSVFDLVSGLERPEWTGCVQDLWENLGDLVKFSESVAHLREQSCLIAIELVADSCSAGEISDWRRRVLEVVPPRSEDPSFRLLGYDVADYYLLSGLMNCESSLRHDSSHWRPLLNQYHLFRDAGSALEFKYQVADHYREHAPFFVFALWRREP